MLADAAGREVHDLVDRPLDDARVHRARAVQVGVDRQRPRHADGVGELDGAAVGQPAATTFFAR
jgi:hypothetical protein